MFMMEDDGYNIREQCPLCNSTSDCTIKGADGRKYCRCMECKLIFVPESDHLSLADERARYETHQNSIENAGYVEFLNRLLEPVSDYLEPGMRGLDYGCGPGPTLSKLARERGFVCDDYDPLFMNAVLEKEYDFILSTECFEHFRKPELEISRILNILAPRGILGIMTEVWQDTESFSNWYYTRDPTHVCFYHLETILHMCDAFAMHVLWSDLSRVFILQKN